MTREYTPDTSESTGYYREFQVFAKPVGARCNLHCSYCYYLEKQKMPAAGSLMTMSDSLLDLYIRQHIEASAENEIFFSWHGGEPTLAGIDFFRKAVLLQKKYKPAGRNVINGIQTNATMLTDEWGAFLKEENFCLGISIDGTEEHHDHHRMDNSGKGSYKTAMRGLEIAMKFGIPCEILCVVNNVNVVDPATLYRFFRDLGISFITFLPLVEYLPANASPVSDRSVKPYDFGRFLSEIFDMWLEKDIGRIKVQVFEEALRTAFQQEHTLCIFKKTCGGVPVVERNGDFYSCDHYVNPEHLIGNISSMNLAEMLDHPRQKAFGEAKRTSLPEYCHECEVLDMCNGECPRNRFMTTPSGEAGLNYLCQGYRHFFNHCRPFVNEVARVWKM